MKVVRGLRIAVFTTLFSFYSLLIPFLPRLIIFIVMNRDDSIIVVTKAEFREFVEETVGALLERRIPKIIRRANRKEYLTTAEFKELCGISYRKQHYLRQEKKISFSQEGRSILYRTEDVEKFMEERRIEAQGEE